MLMQAAFWAGLFALAGGAHDGSALLRLEIWYYPRYFLLSVCVGAVQVPTSHSTLSCMHMRHGGYSGTLVAVNLLCAAVQ